MALRIGPGPVFVYEWLRASRRWQLYAARSVLVGSILAGLCLTWGGRASGPDGYSLAELADLGWRLYATIVSVELTLILLAAPAATAGSIGLDRSRGSLLQVMTTDLTDAEIVLGKLAAGLLPVVGLVFCVLPVLMTASLLGGIDPWLLVGSFFVMVGTAVLVCTLAFALSMGAGQAHEVVGATYLILIAWLALTPLVAPWSLAVASRLTAGRFPMELLEWAAWAAVAANPYALCFPSFTDPLEDHLTRVAGYLTACAAISTALVVGCILRIRPVALRQGVAGRGGRRRSSRLPRLLPRPSLDSNPVLWREWRRGASSRRGRVVEGGYALIAILLTAASYGLQAPFLEHGLVANLFSVGVGLLLTSVRAATSLSEERARGSLDVLLTTPLTTPEIMAGKWWGICGSASLVLALPIAGGFLQCLHSGRWANLTLFAALLATYVALVASAGLALAVRITRPGLAAGLCVGAFVAACVGWPILAGMSTGGEDSPAHMLLLGSPPVGVVLGSLAVADGTPEILFVRGLARHMGSWSLIQGAAALALFATSCGSFDRSMGRAVDRSGGGSLRSLIPRFGRRDATGGGP